MDGTFLKKPRQINYKMVDKPVLVEISNIDMPEKLEIQEGIKKFLEKYQDRWEISSFRIHVDTYGQEGRKKYSFHAKVTASGELFMAKAVSWDIGSTLSTLFEKLGKEIGKNLKKERMEKISTSRKLFKKRV